MMNAIFFALYASYNNKIWTGYQPRNENFYTIKIKQLLIEFLSTDGAANFLTLVED